MAEAYCSWCYQNSPQDLIKENRVLRRVYRCRMCGQLTVRCRYCNNMAKGRVEAIESRDRKLVERLLGAWSNELCAEHAGRIASFEKLSLQLEDIADYQEIFERGSVNLAKVSRYVGLGVAGVVGVAGVAATAGSSAPAVAAALGHMGLLGAASTGTAISSLSGAALSSASLAAIGGSVAVGTAIISASGLALGGVLGGVVANAYLSGDKSFAIRKLSDANATRHTIYINGFTQEKEDSFNDWLAEQALCPTDCSLYGVNWSSKTRFDLGIAFGAGMGTNAAKAILFDLARRGGEKAALRLNPIGWLLLLASLAKNPWHASMFRAAQTGVALADAISRTRGQRFNLVGHSLGCRVIYYALEALASKDGQYVDDVVLLGGAVGRNDQKGWSTALSAVSGTLYNCYSDNDHVLKILYRTTNAGLSEPIGIGPIELDCPTLVNQDCSEFVGSHMAWKSYYGRILSELPFAPESTLQAGLSSSTAL